MRTCGDDLDFEALFDAAPGLYLVLDTAFNMVAANQARLQATMTTREQIIGRNLFEAFPDNPDDDAADGVRNLRASLERVLQTKAADAMAVQKYDIPRPESQGGGFETRYWSPLNTPVLDGRGEVCYIIHRVEDVTDFVALKQNEARLQSRAERVENEIYLRAKEVQEANRRLESANQELTRLNGETQLLAQAQQRFFSQVSHELRTPLTLILGPVDALLARFRLDHEAARELNTIARNARTLLRHVDDLLDVVKHRSTAVELTYARIDLAELLAVAAAHFDSASRGRALSLIVKAPPALPAEADAEKVERIILNLLSNAFKFTPDGGEICCELSVENQEAVLKVSDSGPGVAAHLRDAVFEPFRQGDEGLMRQSSGVGLGLAIVRDFARLHGGKVGLAESARGGALFEVRLPLRAPTQARVAPAATKRLADWNFHQALEGQDQAPVWLGPSHASSPLVLVVEDNREMAGFIARALAARYRVALAANGRLGLELAQTLAPDLIISDLMMPEMSGDQMVGALAQRPNLRAIPVLMLTARADEATRIEALRYGVCDFLAKPFSLEELMVRVDKLIEAKLEADRVKQGRRISDEKFAALMDRARDGVFILTQDGVIVDCNRQARAFCARAALEGVLFEEALEIEASARPLALDTEGVFEAASWSAEGGERRRFEATSAAATFADEAYRLVVVRDVTDQRRAEAQFRRAQKLDALGQLTGGIAHDFNNLLTVIAAHGEALHTRLGNQPEAAQLAAAIERAAERGAGLTQRLLAFARRQDLEPQLCDVNAAVGEIVAMMKRMLPGAIEIRSTLAGDLPHVLIDPTQLEDALLNLAINARDAMPAGGVLTFASSDLAGLAAQAPFSSGVCVSVSDTGAGMSKEVQERVFEPFFTTKGEGRGTGLGLSMVQGFARRAGGDVFVDSVLGRGACVSIVLPTPA